MRMLQAIYYTIMNIGKLADLSPNSNLGFINKNPGESGHGRQERPRHG
jgi:hypothetical protein